MPKDTSLSDTVYMSCSFVSLKKPLVLFAGASVHDDRFKLPCCRITTSLKDLQEHIQIPENEIFSRTTELFQVLVCCAR